MRAGETRGQSRGGGGAACAGRGDRRRGRALMVRDSGCRMQDAGCTMQVCRLVFKRQAGETPNAKRRDKAQHSATCSGDTKTLSLANLSDAKLDHGGVLVSGNAQNLRWASLGGEFPTGYHLVAR